VPLETPSVERPGHARAAVVRQSAEVLGRGVKAKIIPIRSWPERKIVEILDVDVEERP